MTKIRVAVWRDALRESEQRNTPKLVGLVLSTYMNGNGHAYPSRGTLAHGASLSVKAVDTALRELEQGGFLEIARTRGRRTHTYTTILPTTANEVRRSEWEASAATANEVPGNAEANGESDAANGESEDSNREPDDLQRGTTFPRKRIESEIESGCESERPAADEELTPTAAREMLATSNIEEWAPALAAKLREIAAAE
jgi:hypothetical protein